MFPVGRVYTGWPFYFLRVSFLEPAESVCMAAESAFIFSTALRILSAELLAEVSGVVSFVSVAVLLQAKAQAQQSIKITFFI